MYQSNHNGSLAESAAETVEINFIWVGDSPLPANYQTELATLSENMSSSGSQINLWVMPEIVDASVASLVSTISNVKLRSIYELETNKNTAIFSTVSQLKTKHMWAAISDILRIEILSRIPETALPATRIYSELDHIHPKVFFDLPDYQYLKTQDDAIRAQVLMTKIDTAQGLYFINTIATSLRRFVANNEVQKNLDDLLQFFEQYPNSHSFINATTHSFGNFVAESIKFYEATSPIPAFITNVENATELLGVTIDFKGSWTNDYHSRLPDTIENEIGFFVFDFMGKMSDLMAIANIQIIQDQHFSLMNAIMSRSDPSEPLARFTQSLTTEEQGAILKIMESGDNLLMYAIDTDLNLAKSLVSTIEDLNSLDQATILSQTNPQGLNALMIAIMTDATIFKLLFKIVLKLDSAIQAQILNQTSDNKLNLLMLAMLCDTTLIEPILQCLTQLKGSDQVDIMRQADELGSNLLTMAINALPETVMLLVDHIATFTPEHQAKLLLQINNEGSNLLLTAIINQPIMIEPLLDFITKLNYDLQINFLIQTTLKQQALLQQADPSDVALLQSHFYKVNERLNACLSVDLPAPMTVSYLQSCLTDIEDLQSLLSNLYQQASSQLLLLLGTEQLCQLLSTPDHLLTLLQTIPMECASTLFEIVKTEHLEALGFIDGGRWLKLATELESRKVEMQAKQPLPESLSLLITDLKQPLGSTKEKAGILSEITQISQQHSHGVTYSPTFFAAGMPVSESANFDCVLRQFGEEVPSLGINDTTKMDYTASRDRGMK
jgi:hypothetical protein